MKPFAPRLDPRLGATITRLCDEGWEIWAQFDQEVRSRRWHSFVPADYDRVLEALEALWIPGARFLEWGSATGVVAIMADLLGYEAYGIELDKELVDVAVGMAERYGSGVRFAAGSFLPAGYVWRPPHGDGRLGTLGVGGSGYPMLGLSLDDFDLVYGYPWDGEEALMRDLMRVHGGRDARLLLQRASGEVQVFRNGRIEQPEGFGSESKAGPG